MARQNRVRSPGGTITRTVFNALGQAAASYVGMYPITAGEAHFGPRLCSSES